MRPPDANRLVDELTVALEVPRATASPTGFASDCQVDWKEGRPSRLAAEARTTPSPDSSSTPLSRVLLP